MRDTPTNSAQALSNIVSGKNVALVGGNDTAFRDELIVQGATIAVLVGDNFSNWDF